ncbi:cytochrome P450 709B2-like [Exaiptasia diaphana]|uniref:Cytochrome P450 n=1 Tax=Exaiptasia diaphana TaxID=2652724 RepID=A0A913XNV3_EXADI|nr:cytochrome P450 709B2-like [Exaiptasia diaphana]
MILEFLNEIFRRLQSITWQSVILTLIACFAAWVIHKIIQEKLSPLSKIPSPPGRLPFFGHLFTLIEAGNAHYKVQDWHGKYGPIIRFNSGLGFGIGAERVVVYGADLIKQVLVTNSYKFDRSTFIKSLVPGSGNGLFASNGKDHARQRKMINPAFNIANLRTFVPAFVDCTFDLVKVRKELLCMEQI